MAKGRGRFHFGPCVFHNGTGWRVIACIDKDWVVFSRENCWKIDIFAPADCTYATKEEAEEALAIALLIGAVDD